MNSFIILPLSFTVNVKVFLNSNLYATYLHISLTIYGIKKEIPLQMEKAKEEIQFIYVIKFNFIMVLRQYFFLSFRQQSLKKFLIYLCTYPDKLISLLF